MAGDSKKVQPIIIKRIKKGGHAAHGGAWKIAYADFVTAMMAFFLLMWLLGSTTEGDRKGIADYFNSPPRSPCLVVRERVMPPFGQGAATTSAKALARSRKAPPKRPKSGPKKAIQAAQAAAESACLRVLKEKVEEVIANDSRLAQYKTQIRLDMTAEGLRIQIVDDQNRPMFASGDSDVQGYMRDLLRAIGAVLEAVPNRLTIEGHTDSKPFSSGDRGYSNWELSSDRANASRRELIAGACRVTRCCVCRGLPRACPTRATTRKVP